MSKLLEGLTVVATPAEADNPMSDVTLALRDQSGAEVWKDGGEKPFALGFFLLESFAGDGADMTEAESGMREAILRAASLAEQNLRSTAAEWRKAAGAELVLFTSRGTDGTAKLWLMPKADAADAQGEVQLPLPVAQEAFDSLAANLPAGVVLDTTGPDFAPRETHLAQVYGELSGTFPQAESASSAEEATEAEA